jgi:hypothetical protein
MLFARCRQQSMLAVAIFEYKDRGTKPAASGARQGLPQAKDFGKKAA